MKEIEKKFKIAAENALKLSVKPDNDTMLKLYALFKQSQEGDVNGKRPGFTDFKGRLKYDAWTKLLGLPKESAMKSYIELVNSLKSS